MAQASALFSDRACADNGFADRLLRWFDEAGRKDLPWQQNITPYRVWVSEIMLQQTQVSTVVPYYQRFMARFPDVESLASATEDEVLHHWTGLGYYARARNLHRAAQKVVTQFNGIFPSSVEQLLELPGVGRSTAGAICAIAFHKRAAILDGNVKRVLSRFHAIDGWPGTTNVSKILWQKAEQHTPAHRLADYTQAIMDLGATVCSRSSPDCHRCPLQSDCKACARGKQTEYPGKKPKKTLPTKTALFLILQNQEGKVLLQKRPSNGLWGGLWSFPQCNNRSEIDAVCRSLACEPTTTELWADRRHTFSHFHLDYQPALITVRPQRCIREADDLGLERRWHHPATVFEAGTPTPVQQLLKILAKDDRSETTAQPD